MSSREEFEAWASKQKLCLTYGDCGYVFSSTEMAWRAWQAQETKCAALAAENASIKFYLRNGPVIRKGGELAAAHQFAPETPATDAFLAEVRAQGVEMFVAKISHSLRTAGGGDGYHEEPYHEFADYLESKGEDFAVQLRQEAAQ